VKVIDAAPVGRAAVVDVIHGTLPWPIIPSRPTPLGHRRSARWC
jgi:hypothetical protein